MIKLKIRGLKWKILKARMSILHFCQTNKKWDLVKVEKTQVAKKGPTIFFGAIVDAHDHNEDSNIGHHKHRESTMGSLGRFSK